jgi:transposase InsO family protein
VPQDLVNLLLDKEPKVRAALQNPDYKGKFAAIEPPCESWFYAYVRWFKSLPDGGKAIITQRYGAKTWEEEHMVFDSFVEKAQFSRQFVFADHYWLDFFSVDAATRGATGLRFRLWLSFYIDAYSRSITGVSLLLEHPCIESIQTGLRNMVFPKTYLEDLGIDLPWVCYGIPLQLFLDNAWSHHSESLESLAEHLTDDGRFDEMEIVPRAPYKARLGAIIESLFGNLRLQILEELARVGAIRSSKAEDMRNASKAARLLYDDVYKIIHQIIVRYQHTPHSGLNGMTPHEKWLEGIEHFPVEVPQPTEEILHLFLRKAPYTRIRTQKGLRAFGLEYRDDWFELYPKVDSYGKTIQFEVRYDPTDISKLYLFLRKKFLGTVYAKKLRGADGKLQPLPLARKKLALTLARKLNENPKYWFDFLGHIEDINDLAKIRGEEQRHAHQVQLAQSEKVAAEMLSESQAEAHLAAAAGAEGEIASAGALNSAPTSAEAQGPRLTLVPPAKEVDKARGKAGGKAGGKGRGSGTGKTQQRTSHLTVVPNNADAPLHTEAYKAQAEQPQRQDSQPASDPGSDELPPHSPPNAPVFTEEERMRLSGAWASGQEELDY